MNIPFTADRYDAARDCPRGACAVAAIERATSQLLGRSSAADRATALRWLVHLVGDLHQPLHAGDGWDYGGNACHLRLGRRQQPTNLHHIWDTDVVTWATESSREARAIYAELGRRPQDTAIIALPATYPRQQQARVKQLLERAGVRLAAVIAAQRRQ